MSIDILIVDDEADIRTQIAGLLEDEGYATREAHDADTALEAVRARRPSLVLLDIWLECSRLDGVGILKELMKHHPDLPVIMISGHGTIETAVGAIKVGAYDFIEKPFNTDRLLLIINRAIEATELKRENAELRVHAGTSSHLTGDSVPLQLLEQNLERVAPTNSRVFFTGGSGAGKEVAARALHRMSLRDKGPFVVMNCANLEPENIEKSLFGTEGGMDGEEPRIGLLERAHNGTLLLDEVADMPLETQGRMVRALHESRFLRVGGSKPVNVDVRVVASTSRNIEAAMEDGSFRRDLYYRLNVVPLEVPELKERIEDIPVLANHFMKKCSEAAGLPARKFGDDAIAALQAYVWPGNVRQLKNLVEWLLIMAPGEVSEAIRMDMLPSDIGNSTPEVLRWQSGGDIMALPLREARELFEREYLSAQVSRFGGNISRTSSFVGMERSALHRKLKSLGLTGSGKSGPNNKSKNKKETESTAA